MIALNPSGGKIPSKEPPTILIDLKMVEQMRKRKQMLADLLAWAQKQGVAK